MLFRFPGIKHIMRYDEEAKSQSSIRDDTVTFRNRVSFGVDEC